MSKWFAPSEFKKCTPSCKIEQMDGEFMDILDNIREAAGIPLVLTSAYRSVAYEKKKGRTGKSAHTKGKAVDIRCSTNANRMKIVRAALSLGICRIGIGKNFIHVDNDGDLTQDVMWHYYG